MLGKKLRSGDNEQATVKKRTRREQFLAEMEKVVARKAMIELIDSHHPKTSSKSSSPPYPLPTTPRINLL